MQPTDNNQETIQPVQNLVTPPVLPPIQNTTSSNKMIVWIVVILVLIILAAGGAYWYLNYKQTIQQIEVTQQPTAVPSPTPVSLNDLEGDLNSIDAEASTSGFETVDSDLNGLK